MLDNAHTAAMSLNTQAPLSFQQQWLWGLLQSYKDWGCVVSYGFALRGNLEVQHLERSLERLIQHHGSLRTKIVVVAGEVVQEAVPLRGYTLEYLTVPGESPDEIETHARALLLAFSQAPVVATSELLFRAKLLKLGEREHWLLLAMHRLVGDCFSVDQLMPEVWTSYTDSLQGRVPSVTINPPQYNDYARRQRHAHPDWVKRHQEFWARQLEAAHNVQWPTDAYAARVPQGTLGRMNIHFGADLSERLREWARSQRTLLASVMLAIYVMALCRYCKQRDFVVPCFVAGRQSEHKSVVGYFSHILYVRVRLSGAETCIDLMRYVANEFFRALSHQDFGQMATQQPRLLRGTFFQWLTWHPEEACTVPEAASQDMRGLMVEPVSVAEFAEYLTAIPPGMVDVELTVFDTSEGIYASGVYRADLFSQATMDAFMSYLRETAEGCLRNPNAAVSPPARC